jgi:hypothetical protein
MGKSESTGFNKIIFFWFLKLPGVVILQLTIASNFYYFVLLAQTFFLSARASVKWGRVFILRWSKLPQQL